MSFTLARARSGSFACVSYAKVRVSHRKRSSNPRRHAKTFVSGGDIDLDALLPPDIDGDLESLQRESGAVIDDDGFVLNFGAREEELEAIKTAVGVIDRSDWGLIRSSGPGAPRALTAIAANHDGLALTPAGSGFEIKVASTNDTAQVYCQSEGFLIVVPPSSIDAVANVLESSPEQNFMELNDQCALLTVVGPQCADVLSKTGLVEVLTDAVGAHRVFGFENRPVVAAHTREFDVPGVNLIIDEAIAGQVWATITRAGVIPCGSQASDEILRGLGRLQGA